MISYYPNMKSFNEAFDRLVWYKEGDEDVERKTQLIYELCYDIYCLGVADGLTDGKTDVKSFIAERSGLEKI